MTDDDPVTLSIMAAGAAMSAVGSIGGAIQQKAAYGRQAQEDTEQGHNILRAGGAQISAQDYNAGKTISEGVANAGASGGQISGAMPVISEDYSQAKIKDMYTKYSSQIAANQEFYKAKTDKWQGQQALYKGIFKATSNILGSTSSAASQGMLGSGMQSAFGGGGGAWNIGVGSGGNP